MATVEDLHRKHFGNNPEQEFNDAVHSLWARRCQHPRSQDWPPTAEEIAKEIETNRTWKNDTRLAVDHPVATLTLADG